MARRDEDPVESTAGLAYILKVKKEGHKMKVEYLDPAELVPYGKNAKAHPPKQVDQIANSIKRFGWQQPIVVDRKKVVIIGHGRFAAAKQLMLDKVPVVYADNLSDADVKALRLADNKLNESEWLEDLLAEELAELDIDGIDMSQFGFDLEEAIEHENPYTQKTDIPQYQITGEHVTVDELFQDTKTRELLDEIERSTVDEKIKGFLRLAAYRHVIFNYQNIAEFYANSEPETQELMEKSALVIIDIDDAIKNGYTLLRDEIADIVAGDDEYE